LLSFCKTFFFCQQIQDDDIPNVDEPQKDKKEKVRSDDFRDSAETLSSVTANHSDDAPIQNKEVLLLSKSDLMLILPCAFLNYKPFCLSILDRIYTISIFQDGFNNLQDLEGSLASFPSKPLQALKYVYLLGLSLSSSFFFLNFQVLAMCLKFGLWYHMCFHLCGNLYCKLKHCWLYVRNQVVRFMFSNYLCKIVIMCKLSPLLSLYLKSIH